MKKADLNFKLFMSFQKKNEEEHLVEGYATSEALDSQGEIIKIDAIEKALPDYMKFANIREMHTFSAVGKAVSAEIDPEKKALYLVAKVVDPIAWEKVKEGVYNGFSIGGRVLKRVGNIIHELSLHEISLVDRPANPEAVFALYKADKGETAGEDAGMEAEGPLYNEVFEAAKLLELAAQLVFMYDMKSYMGHDTAKLEQAITLLEELAKECLTGEAEPKKKFAALMAYFHKKYDAKPKIEAPAPVAPITDVAKAKPNTWVNGYFDGLQKAL